MTEAVVGFEGVEDLAGVGQTVEAFGKKGHFSRTRRAAAMVGDGGESVSASNLCR